ncbi:MAG: hypothetical protein KDB10_07425 [Acidimicrobiales bacterium]|nr:hypothetical protein [Acidimicrobiales bacterium]
MDDRQLVRSLAVGRVAIGAALVAAPSLAAGGWAGAEARRPATKVFLRALGVRDLVLGIGTLRALERGDDPTPWARYGAAADGVDAAATLLGYRALRPRGRFAVLALAVAAAAGGAVAAERLAEANRDV